MFRKNSGRVIALSTCVMLMGLVYSTLRVRRAPATTRWHPDPEPGNSGRSTGNSKTGGAGEKKIICTLPRNRVTKSAACDWG